MSLINLFYVMVDIQKQYQFKLLKLCQNIQTWTYRAGFLNL